MTYTAFNIQFETAYNIFKDFYGEPKWMVDPKEGQNPDVIIEQWCRELAQYSVEQIRQACSWLTRKRRVMTFPMLDSLLAELSDKTPERKSDETPAEKAIRIYNYLLKNDQDRTVSFEDWKMLAQKVVYDSYNVSVDGYIPNAT